MINARIHTNTGPNVNTISSNPTTEHQTHSAANIEDENAVNGVEISEPLKQQTAPEISIVAEDLAQTEMSDGRQSKATSSTTITGPIQETNVIQQLDPMRTKRNLITRQITGYQLGTISGSTNLKSIIKTNTDSSTSGRVKYILKNMFNFSLLNEPVYVLSSLFMVLAYSNRVVILSQTVSAAVHKGHTYKESAYLLTIMGITNLVCRLISSVVMNLKCLNPMWYSCVGALSLTGAGFVMAFAHSYPMFVCGGILMGGFEGE